MTASPLAEALDPSTDPARLSDLAQHNDEEVWWAARLNPNLSERDLFYYLRAGDRVTWANPAVPFVLLLNPGDSDFLFGAKKAIVQTFHRPSRRIAPALRETAVPLVVTWWQTENDIDPLLNYLGVTAETDGYARSVHRQVVRLALRFLDENFARLPTPPGHERALKALRTWVDTSPPPSLDRLSSQLRLEWISARDRRMRREERSRRAVYEVAALAASPLNATSALRDIARTTREALRVGDDQSQTLLPIVREVFPLPPLPEELGS